MHFLQKFSTKTSTRDDNYYVAIIRGELSRLRTKFITTRCGIVSIKNHKQPSG